MTIRSDLLATWSERLCRLHAGGAADAAAALGIAGTLVERVGATLVEPPPPGCSRLMLVERNGAIDHVDLALDAGAPTRADFDARFGQGAELVRIHPGTPHKLAYHVEVAGAPFTCEVIARFRDEPAGDTPAIGVLLRRDRA
jgi:hypothetical protein